MHWFVTMRCVQHVICRNLTTTSSAVLMPPYHRQTALSLPPHLPISTQPSHLPSFPRLSPSPLYEQCSVHCSVTRLSFLSLSLSHFNFFNLSPSSISPSFTSLLSLYSPTDSSFTDSYSPPLCSTLPKYCLTSYPLPFPTSHLLLRKSNTPLWALWTPALCRGEPQVRDPLPWARPRQGPPGTVLFPRCPPSSIPFIKDHFCKIILVILAVPVLTPPVLLQADNCGEQSSSSVKCSPRLEQKQ